MRCKLAGALLRGVPCLLAVVALIAALSAFASAQSRPAPRPGLSERERNIMGREHQLRTLEHGRPANTAEEARVKLAQINEDFLRLQVINNEMRVMASAIELDYQSLVKATEELRRRSLRLKKNLVFAQAEAGARPAQGTGAVTARSKVQAALAALDQLKTAKADDGRVKAAVITLIATIKSFTTNPLFQQANVLDLDLSLKASEDLDAVIELSDRLRRLSKKLSEAAKSAS